MPPRAPGRVQSGLSDGDGGRVLHWSGGSGHQWRSARALSPTDTLRRRARSFYCAGDRAGTAEIRSVASRVGHRMRAHRLLARRPGAARVVFGPQMESDWSWAANVPGLGDDDGLTRGRVGRHVRHLSPVVSTSATSSAVSSTVHVSCGGEL